MFVLILPPQGILTMIFLGGWDSDTGFRPLPGIIFMFLCLILPTLYLRSQAVEGDKHAAIIISALLFTPCFLVFLMGLNTDLIPLLALTFLFPYAYYFIGTWILGENIP
jgi:hypothetical protein